MTGSDLAETIRQTGISIIRAGKECFARIEEIRRALDNLHTHKIAIIRKLSGLSPIELSEILRHSTLIDHPLDPVLPLDRIEADIRRGYCRLS